MLCTFQEVSIRVEFNQSGTRTPSKTSAYDEVGLYVWQTTSEHKISVINSYPIVALLVM